VQVSSKAILVASENDPQCDRSERQENKILQVNMAKSDA